MFCYVNVIASACTALGAGGGAAGEGKAHRVALRNNVVQALQGVRGVGGGWA